jgi:hypothetical protein
MEMKIGMMMEMKIGMMAATMTEMPD